MDALSEENSIKHFPIEKEDLETSIKDRFEKTVRSFPDRIALREALTDVNVTYREMNATANRIARMIVDQIGTENEPVALLFSHGPDSMISVLGALKARKICVPLDLAFPINRNSVILEESGTRVLVTNNEALSSLQREIALTEVSIINIDEIDVSVSGQNLDVVVSPNDNCCIFYTSGSTGNPKGIYYKHQAVLQLSLLNDSGKNRFLVTDQIGAALSYSFAGSLSNFHPLFAGATLQFYDVKKQSLASFGPWLAKEKINAIIVVPSLFRYAAKHLEEHSVFPDLRVLRLAGETITKHDVELFKHHTLPGAYLRNTLALTECASVASLWIGHNDLIDSRIVPVGFEEDDAEVMLVDDEGQPVKHGEVGEILVRSSHLATGYWKNESLTAEKFLSDPNGGDRLIVKTGDLGRRLPDGSLIHLGRKDAMVKVRGYRVETAEIEVALVEHSAVKEAVVNAFENRWGEQQLAAYIVTEKDAIVTASDLRDWLDGLLPDYMIPSHFQQLDALPMTATGKIDRHALPVPAIVRPDLPNALVGPRDGLEQEIRYIWQSVFGFAPIGVTDDFFDLGGHSLLALQLFSRMEAELRRPMTIDILHEASTIAEMAQYLRRNSANSKERIAIPLKTGVNKPPLFLVHAIAGHVLPYYELTRQMDDDQPIYGIQAQGKDGKGKPFDDLTRMARKYIKEIRRIQPEGPYYLGGLSMGGVIALEMALQLQDAGQEVALVAMIDSFYGEDMGDAASRKGYPIALNHDAVPEDQVPTFERAMRSIQEDVQSLGQRSLHKGLDYLISRLAQLWRWQIIRRVYQLFGKENIFRQNNWSPAKRLKGAHGRAIRRYKPAHKYDGRVIFFRASESDPALTYLAWAEWVEGELTIVTLEGSHRSILEEPTAKEIARELASYLD